VLPALLGLPRNLAPDPLAGHEDRHARRLTQVFAAPTAGGVTQPRARANRRPETRVD
jgi:hypothetical protein